MKRSISGFTVVELLIVIVVIGILARLTLVAYNGVQGRARDTQRTSDLQNIADSIKAYRVKYNNDIETGSGCGWNGGGTGWFNAVGGSYPATILSCLTSAGYLNDSVIDPSGCTTVGGSCLYAYMKYTCVINGQTVSYIYARLETGGDPTKTRNSGGCNATTVVDSYGMNFFAVAD
jgi:prepilin-type N-terminal cleavage/methylation domain-containing protein